METVKAMTPKEWVRFLQHIDAARAIKVIRVEGALKELRKQLGNLKVKESKKLDPKTQAELEKLASWYTLNLRLLKRVKERIVRSLTFWGEQMERGPHV